MNKAYIILAHRNPAQVYRLITRLNDRSSSFYVHIDKKTNLSGFSMVMAQQKVSMIENVRMNWAGFSIVEAILNGLKAIKESKVNFDSIILLSGQDYPIKNNACINNYLSTSPFRVFMEHFTLPNHQKWQPNGGMYRVNKYYFGLKPHQQYMAKALNFSSGYLPFLRRKLPGTLRPFAGSTWWIIDMYALNYILDFVNSNPDYTRFHKHTFSPDEVFFQTIIMNSTDKGLTDSVSNDNKRLIRWSDIHAAHPQLLTRNDMEDILMSDALFARKFDLYESPEVLDLIDLYCLSNKQHYN